MNKFTTKNHSSQNNMTKISDEAFCHPSHYIVWKCQHALARKSNYFTRWHFEYVWKRTVLKKRKHEGPHLNLTVCGALSRSYENIWMYKFITICQNQKFLRIAILVWKCFKNSWAIVMLMKYSALIHLIIYFFFFNNSGS